MGFRYYMGFVDPRIPIDGILAEIMWLWDFPDIISSSSINPGETTRVVTNSSPVVSKKRR